MTERHRKIIDAVIEKARVCCPDALELIGIYGSAATGDVHEKSDLDLLIVTREDNCGALAACFILEDCAIGYDLYLTSWKQLSSDALCEHPHLAKLLDSKIVYTGNPQAQKRLEALRSQASALLSSDAGLNRARHALDKAKCSYADCCLADSIGKIRSYAGNTVYELLNALMLYRGRYFKKGLKRTFEELEAIGLPFDPKEKTLAVIRAETAEDIRKALGVLLCQVQAHITPQQEKQQPSPDNLTGTCEEMFSNWRNKMVEAAQRQDLFSSFMNLCCLQAMLDDISAEVNIRPLDALSDFDPRDLEKNRRVFDHILSQYALEYQRLGMHPKCYADVDAFVAAYLA